MYVCVKAKHRVRRNVLPSTVVLFENQADSETEREDAGATSVHGGVDAAVLMHPQPGLPATRDLKDETWCQNGTFRPKHRTMMGTEKVPVSWAC